MRDSPIALIEFHWLSSATATVRKAAAPRKRLQRAPATGGYQLPGRGWRAFVGGGIYCRWTPIVFLHVVPEEQQDVPARAVWHRVH